MVISTAVLVASLSAAIVVLGALLVVEHRKASSLAGKSKYDEGYRAGRDDVIHSIRYEQEIHECRRNGLLKKEVTLTIRERVMLGHLRISESEREVTIASDVDAASVWSALEHMGALLATPGAGQLVRVLAPAAKAFLSDPRRSKGRPKELGEGGRPEVG